MRGGTAKTFRGGPANCRPPPARRNGVIEPSMQPARRRIRSSSLPFRVAGTAIAASPTGHVACDPSAFSNFVIGSEWTSHARVSGLYSIAVHCCPWSRHRSLHWSRERSKVRDYRDHRPQSGIRPRQARPTDHRLRTPGPSGRPRQVRTKPRSVPPSPCQPPVMPSGVLFWRRKYAGAPTVGKGRGLRYSLRQGEPAGPIVGASGRMTARRRHVDGEPAVRTRDPTGTCRDPVLTGTAIQRRQFLRTRVYQ